MCLCSFIPNSTQNHVITSYILKFGPQRSQQKLTTAELVETSVTTNSLSKHYPHPDDHVKQIHVTVITPGFKPLPFTCTINDFTHQLFLQQNLAVLSDAQPVDYGRPK